MEQFMYDERPSSSYSQAAEALPNIEKTTGSKDNDEECWDDCNHKTYDPKLYVQNNYIIRNIQHGLKSERKKERQAEKARLDEIDRKNYEEENPRGNGFTTGGYTDQSFTSGANNPGKKRK